MSERWIVRCYECHQFVPDKRSKSMGYCKDLEKRVHAVDWCWSDEVPEEAEP